MRNDGSRRVKDLAAMEYGLFKDKGHTFLNNLNKSDPPLFPQSISHYVTEKKERKSAFHTFSL